MSKAADATAVAIRLDNLEQKFSGSGGGGADSALIERLYERVFMGSETSPGPFLSPWSANQNIFDETGISLSWSIWGGWGYVALQNAIGDGVAGGFTPLYNQIFHEADTRWLSHGAYAAEPANPLASAVFGLPQPDPSQDYRELLRGGSLAGKVFGSPGQLSDLGGGSVLGRVEALEGRVTTLESKVADLEAWANVVDAALATHASRLDGHASRLTALEGA